MMTARDSPSQTSSFQPQQESCRITTDYHVAVTLPSSTSVTWNQSAPITASAKLVCISTQASRVSNINPENQHQCNVTCSQQRSFSDGYFSHSSVEMSQLPSQSDEDHILVSESSDSYPVFTSGISFAIGVPLDLRLPKVKPWKQGYSTEQQEQERDKNKSLRRHSDSAVHTAGLAASFIGCGTKTPHQYHSQYRSQSSSSERDSLEELRHLQSLTIRQEHARDARGDVSEADLLSGKRLKLKNYLLHKYQHSLQEGDEKSISNPTYVTAESPRSPRQQQSILHSLFSVPLPAAPPSSTNLAEHAAFPHPHHLHKPGPKHSSIFSLKQRYRESNILSSSSTSEGESDASSAVTSPSLSSTSTFTTPANSPLRDQGTPTSLYFQFPSSPRLTPAITSVASSRHDERGGSLARRALRAHLKRKMSSSGGCTSAPTGSSSTDTEDYSESRQTTTSVSSAVPLSPAVVSLMSDLTLKHRHHHHHQFQNPSTAATSTTDVHHHQHVFQPVHSLSWQHHAVHVTLSDPTVTVVNRNNDLGLTSVGLCCPSCGERFSSFSLLAQHAADKKCSQLGKQATARVAKAKVTESETATQQSEQSRPPSSSSKSSSVMCTLCGRSFSRGDMLSRHMRLHTGLRPYICSTCGQTFTRSDHLNTHMRSHTGEKPYKCAYCPYAAPRRDMITRHQKTHEAVPASVSGEDAPGRSGGRQRQRHRAGASSGFWRAQRTSRADSRRQEGDSHFRQYKSLSSTESSEGEGGQVLVGVGDRGARKGLYPVETGEERTLLQWSYWPNIDLNSCQQQMTAAEYNRQTTNTVTGSFIAYDRGREALEGTMGEDPRKPCWLLPTLTESQDQSPLTRSPSNLSVTSNSADDIISSVVTITNTAVRHPDNDGE